MIAFWLANAFTSHLAELLARRPGVRGALVTYSLVRYTNPLDNLLPNCAPARATETLTNCRWLISDDVLAARHERDYGNLLLGECWIEGCEEMVEELAGVLGSTKGDPVPMPKIWIVGIDGRHPRDDVGYQTVHGERIDGHGDVWPSWVFRAKRAHDAPVGTGVIPLGALAGSGLRPYESSVDAINDWFGGAAKAPVRRTPGLAFHDQFTVVLPDTRARVVRTTFDADKLHVEIASNARGVLVQGVAHTAGGKVDLAASPVAPSISWSIPAETTRIQLYLVAENEIVSSLDVKRPIAVVAPPTPKPAAPSLPDYVPSALPEMRTEPEAAALARSIDVLVVVAVRVELDAVLRRLRPLDGTTAVLQAHVQTRTYYLGRLGAHRVAVVMSEMGAVARGGSVSTTLSAVSDWQPRAVIMPGIAFGANPTKQRMADVLVATLVASYEPQRVGTRQTIHRGPIVQPGETLLNRFRNAIGWTFLLPDGTKADARFGLFLSGEKLVDNAAFKAKLFEEYPEAIGGDMEAVGIYTGAGKTDWIVVKAICDWADGTKGKSHQALAAAASVSLVEYVLENPHALSGLGPSAR